MMYERLLISELYKRLVTRTKNENQSLYATQTNKLKAEEEAAGGPERALRVTEEQRRRMKEWEAKVEGQTDWAPWENPAANGTAPARSDDEEQDDEEIAGGDREEVEEERRRQDEVTEEEADEATQREAAGLAEGHHMLIEELEAELQARRLDSPIDGGAEDEAEPTFATRQDRVKKAGSKMDRGQAGEDHLVTALERRRPVLWLVDQ